jgi:hypothetical protein
MVKMNNPHLTQYLYGARIIAKVNQQNRRKQSTNRSVQDIFAGHYKHKIDTKKDESELDPGEP